MALKKIKFQIIGRDEVLLSGNPYAILDEVRAENHFETAQAKIACAWQKGMKHDADNRLTLGKCVKQSDLQRELIDFDFVIVLNREVWEDPEFTAAQKKALIDHEMCHAARATDSEGAPLFDTKGRPVYRIRHHDIEEFREIVARHGLYKRDLEMFGQEILKKQRSPLLASLTITHEDVSTLNVGHDVN